MKITIQNIIRILLVILMMTGSIQWGSVAYAQSLPGSGTEEDPYVIKSAADWSTFVSDIKSRYDYNGKFVKLTKNISIENSENNYYNGAGDGGYFFDKALGDAVVSYDNTIYACIELYCRIIASCSSNYSNYGKLKHYLN